MKNFCVRPFPTAGVIPLFAVWDVEKQAFIQFTTNISQKQVQKYVDKYESGLWRTDEYMDEKGNTIDR